MRRARGPVAPALLGLLLAMLMASSSVSASTIAAAPTASSESANTTDAAPGLGFHRPPVEAPVTDPFRPPPSPYGSGNRGVDFATAPDDLVHASAPGVVTFAGTVGGSLHVVVLHADGLRTSYSFLGSIAVQRGQTVSAGTVLGKTGERPLHFGARSGDEYVDPMALFAHGARRQRVRLVPDNGRGLPPESLERRALARLVRAVGAAAGASGRAAAWTASRVLGAADWLTPEAAERVAAAMARFAATGDTVRLAQELARELPDPELAPIVAAVLRAAARADSRLGVALNLAAWQLTRGPCTPRSTPRPAPPRQRRLAVLVGGLGSSSGHAAILDLDTEALGYAEDDTVQFSYRGGTSDENAYSSEDTQADLEVAARHLSELLDRLAREHPGVPIDVFAHSQGGLVARAALSGLGESPSSGAQPTSSPAVRHLVTFGTPHSGADLARMVTDVKRTPGGMAAAAVGSKLRPLGLDPSRSTLGELAPSSAFITELSQRPLPSSIRATSIATRLDVVVPAPRSWLKGADNVIVPSHGVNAHGRLPGSGEALREAALAVADLPPTCESLIDAVLDTATATAVQVVERTASDLMRPEMIVRAPSSPFR